MKVSWDGVETDVEVVEGFQRNDEGLQRRFYRRCWAYYCDKRSGTFEFHASAATPDDLFQDAFLKLWEEIQSFHIQVRDGVVCRYNKEHELRKMSASLLTFFMSIAKNKNFELFHDDEFLEELAPQMGEEMVEEEAEERVLDRIARWCVYKLPDRCKDILTKFYYYGMSLDEILEAREENTSKDGLKTGKAKCMKLLKNHILEKCKTYKIKSHGHV